MTKEASKQVESDLIWDEIKELSIDIFSLPNQKVSDHVNKLNIPGNQLFVSLNSSAVLPALEIAVTRRGFEVEQTPKYIIVRRAEQVVDVSSLIEKK